MSETSVDVGGEDSFTPARDDEPCVYNSKFFECVSLLYFGYAVMHVMTEIKSCLVFALRKSARLCRFS